MVAISAVDWAGRDSAIFVTVQYFALTKSSGLCLEIASTTNGAGEIELLNFQILSPALALNNFPKAKGSPQEIPSKYISSRYELTSALPRIDLSLIFKSFSGTILRQALSAHLMARFISDDKNQPMDMEQNLDLLADRYLAFTTWNEASPAKYLALITHQPVERVHTRLKVARRRGLIPVLGKGIRVNKNI